MFQVNDNLSFSPFNLSQYLFIYALHLYNIVNAHYSINLAEY